MAGSGKTALLFCMCVALFLGLTEAKSASNKDKILPSPCLNGYPKTMSEHLADVASWENCIINGTKVIRTDIIAWMKRGFDRNNDGALTPDEVEFAQRFFLTETERQIEPTAVVFDRCDCDNDGFITEQDFIMAEYTCLRNCAVGHLMWELIGSRISADNAYDSAPIMPTDEIDPGLIAQAAGKKHE